MFINRETQPGDLLAEGQQGHYNKSSVPLKSLTPGQSVHLRNTATGQMEPASVQSKDSDRSSTVQTPEGETFRRNRVHLRESAVSSQRSTSGEIYMTRSGRKVQKPKCYKSD